jgi:putative membrane protein
MAEAVINHIKKNINLILVCVYTVGVCGLSTPSLRGLFIFLTPVNILMASAILLLYHQPFTTKFILHSVAIAISGFLIEWAGVTTGVIFGAYSYDEGLGAKLIDVPLIIGLNWFFMVYTTCVIAGFFKIPMWLKAVLAAFLMVIYDLALEQSAAALNMWTWAGSVIPLQNYVAWFLIGLVMTTSFFYLNLDVKNKIAFRLYIIQLLFFVILYSIRTFKS